MEPVLYKSPKEIAAAHREALRNHHELTALYASGQTDFEPVKHSARRLKTLCAAYKVAKEEARYGIT